MTFIINKSRRVNNSYKLARERQINTKMSKKHFTKRKANGQYAYGKILISHHGNLNQNHREILFHTELTGKNEVMRKY